MYTKEQLQKLQNLPLSLKFQITTTRIIEWYQHYDGKVYVAFSGGKDSTVLLDIVRRIYPDVPAVFSDTGLEFPEVRKFAMNKDNVTVIRPEMNFRKVIETFGYPIISKRTAETIEYGGKPGSFRWKELHGEVMMQNGKPSKFNCQKWCYLLDAPFKVSARCCDIMKKKPIKYNGPPVKTTPRKKCVNQDLEILILSRPEPPLNRPDNRRVSRRRAGSLDRAAMACYNGRPRGRTHNLVLTSPHPRRYWLNRPAAFCQGRRKAARNRPDKRLPASHSPALRGAAGCYNR